MSRAPAAKALQQRQHHQRVIPRKRPLHGYPVPVYEDPVSVCDDCGAEVEDGMECPDGAFVCHECFNNGAH